GVRIRPEAERGAGALSRRGYDAPDANLNALTRARLNGEGKRMEFGVWTKGLATLGVDCLVLGIFEEGELSGEARSVDAASSGALQRLLARGDFAGRAGDPLLIGDLPGIKATRVLLTGLGSKKSFSRRSWRKAWAAAAAALSRTRIGSCAVAIDRPDARQLDDYYFGRSVAELAGAALYRINDLKTGKKPPLPELKRVLAGPVRRAAAAERGLSHGAAIAAAADVQRDLANLPANICTPSFLAAQARERARRAASLRVRVLDEAAIRREKMGWLLAALTLASQLKLRLHVVGLIAAVENMPGGKAVKPGDIATSASGQTVEILNTDAEGRLILCDALNYARRFEPAAVVDIATLTG